MVGNGQVCGKQAVSRWEGGHRRAHWAHSREGRRGASCAAEKARESQCTGGSGSTKCRGCSLAMVTLRVTPAVDSVHCEHGNTRQLRGQRAAFSRSSDFHKHDHLALPAHHSLRDQEDGLCSSSRLHKLEREK